MKEKPKKLTRSYKVHARNVKFLSLGRKDVKKTIDEFGSLTKKLERFLRILERKCGQVIWYIGTDILDNNIVERFLFSKSGFMEIIIKKETQIKAYFPTEKQAKKFTKALKIYPGRRYRGRGLGYAFYGIFYSPGVYNQDSDTERDL